MEAMTDALLDIQFICNIMSDVHRDAQLSGVDPIDLQYSKLLTRMDVVPDDHDDYKLILKYITNGVGATHGYKGFQLLDVSFDFLCPSSSILIIFGAFYSFFCFS